jgi:hypothetical protein
VKAFIRKTALILAALLAVMLLLLLALSFAVGPFLNSRAFQRLALRAVNSMTGLSCAVERIRFAYPFRLTAEGLSVEGRAAEFSFEVHAGRATVVSGPTTILRARVDEIGVEDIELDASVIERSGQKQEAPASLDGRPFEAPAWLWRIGRAALDIATIRLHSKHGSICIEDLYAAWDREGGGGGKTIRKATLRLSPGGREGQAGDLVFRVTPRQVTALSGPAFLPVLDLAALAAFAGLEIPVTGSLSGAVFPSQGGPPLGPEALYLDLFAEDIVLQEELLGLGFAGASLQMSGLVLLPGRGAGLGLLLDSVAASVEGLALRGERFGPGLGEADLLGSMHFDTLSDHAEWTLKGQDRLENLSFHAEGSLDGVLRGARRAIASVSARARDLRSLALGLPTAGVLPAGTTIEGTLSAEATLAGSREEMDVRGSVKTSGLEIVSGRTFRLPVLLDADFSGSLGAGGGPVAIRLDSNRFEAGGLFAKKLSLSYGPAGVSGMFAIESVDAPHLVSLLRHHLPGSLSAYQWGGTVDLSVRVRTDAGEQAAVRGHFTARLRNGLFTSPDYRRMGEGIDSDVTGAFHVPADRSSVDLALDVALPKGEIVVGDLYGNLATTRPLLLADLAYHPESGDLRIRSARAMLEGVGDARLEGRLSRRGRAARGKARVDFGPIHLAGLMDRLLREGLGALYPGIGEAEAAGTVSLTSEVDIQGGLYRVLGRLALQEVSLQDSSKGLSVSKIGLELPFSLSAGPDSMMPSPVLRSSVQPGTLVIEGINFRGLEVPGIHATLLLAGNALRLASPTRIALSGGLVNVDRFSLEGLGWGSGRLKGRATLEIDDLDLAPIVEAATGRAMEGRLTGRFEQMDLDDGIWTLAGRLALQVRNGDLRLEDIRVQAPLSGRPSGGCSIRASGIPLDALAGGLIRPAPQGTLDGWLPTVRLSEERLEAEGSLTLSAFKGTVTLSGLSAEGLHEPQPTLQLDLDMREIDLRTLTAPFPFGSISGVLEGRVHGLRVHPGFPYATAFDADLKTVRRRGVPRKIDATAVANLSRIGGSNQLASVLSKSLYRYFDEYYYKEMGLRATLEDGWLKLQGIPRDGKQYLVLPALRIPTLSMPVAVLTPNRKIRFNRWLKDLLSLGQAPAAGPP